MTEQEQDWAVPTATEWESLWACLHDGRIRGVSHDPLARTLRLDVELGFPKPPIPFPEKTTLVFADLTHALVFVSEDWPGGYPVFPPTIDPQARELLFQEFRDKGYVTTLSVDGFAATLGKDQVEILQARWSKPSGNVLAELEGVPGFRLLIGSRSVSVETDLGTMDLEQLVQIGDAGWDAWQARKP